MRLSTKLGFTILRHVFGPALSIAHWGSIVVHPDVVFNQSKISIDEIKYK